MCTGQYGFVNKPFPGSPGPLFQNEVKCSAFDMEMIFHSHANKTHFHKKGYALGLILKVKVLELGSGLLLRDKTSPIETGILYIWLGEVEISSVEACYRIAVIQVWEEFTIFEYKG